MNFILLTKLILFLFFILDSNLKFVKAELGVGECPELKDDIKSCKEIFEELRYLNVFTTIAFLPSSYEANAFSIFAFNFSNIQNVSGLLDCDDYRFKNSIAKSYRYEEIGPEFLSENGTSRPIIINETKNIECISKIEKAKKYKFSIRFKTNQYFLLFGCLQINSSMHDRGFWIYNINETRDNFKNIFETALSDSNLDGFVNNKNIIFYDDTKMLAEINDENFYYHNCYNKSLDKSRFAKKVDLSKEKSVINKGKDAIQNWIALIVFIVIGVVVIVIICVTMVLLVFV